MLSTRLEALRDTAALTTLEAIRRDIDRASIELKPLLTFIEAHLFDSEFSVRAMRLAGRTRDNSIVTRFRAYTGSRPTVYVRERRLTVASELLRRTSEEVWKIAELVGFASPQVFTRNFKIFCGQAPGAYRKQHQEPVANGVGLKTMRRSEFEQAKSPKPVSGVLLDRGLDRQSGSHYRFNLASCSDSSSDSGSVDLVGAIYPREMRKRLVEQASGTSESWELFESLREQGIEVGRRNRHLGVRIAEIALASVEGSLVEFGDSLLQLRALAWACVGNARRLALDFSGAEVAFERSSADLSIKDPQVDVAVKAEVYALKAAFRTVQHKFDEAKALIAQTLGWLRQDSNLELRARVLSLRSSIFGYLGEYETSIADLTGALRLGVENERVKLCIHHNLATTFTYAGDFKSAAAAIHESQRLWMSCGTPLERVQLLWLAGLVNKGQGSNKLAETQFLAARRGFRGLREWRHAGIVSLDLALLWHPYAHPEVANLVAEAIPVLEDLGIQRETEAARTLVAASSHCRPVMLDDLQRLRASIDQFLRDPAVILAEKPGL